MFQLIIKKHKNIISDLLTIIILILVSNIIVSCTINDFSNEYSGQIVYSKNSNKIHRPKCGEAQKILEKNYAISTKSIVELINDGYEPCKVCLYYYLNRSTNSIIKNDEEIHNVIEEKLDNIGILKSDYDNFKSMLKKEYGFLPKNETNNNILDILSDLYIGIYLSKKDFFTSNIEYHRIIASAVYHDDESNYSMFDWPLVAKLYFNKFELKSNVSKYLKKIYDNPEEIYGVGYFEHFYDSVSEQYNLANANYNNNDFEHLSAVLCTIANKSNVMNLIINYSQQFNGISDISAQAGYIGDVCGTNWKLPSINNADYKADLDAVNLFHIYENYDKSIFELLPEYYLKVNNNDINRASMFRSNIGENTLALYRKEYIDFLLKIYKNVNVEYMNRINYFDNFMWHIVNNDQNFSPCKYRFYIEYIGAMDKASEEAIKKSYNEWEAIYDTIIN